MGIGVAFTDDMALFWESTDAGRTAASTLKLSALALALLLRNTGSSGS